jgi:nitronate monooxygenase
MPTRKKFVDRITRPKRSAGIRFAIWPREAVDRLLEKEKALGANIKFEDIFGEVAGVYPKVMTEGHMEAGAWSCGMVVGLINDIPTCKELIDRIMRQAEEIITKRLARLV